MPKVKVKRKGGLPDMTAMCDVAFLLLTFFILTTKFKPNEAITVDTPTSISQLPIPDTDMLTISVGTDGRVFFGIDGQFTRTDLLERIAKHKKMPDFTNSEKLQFSLMDNFGVPLNQMKGFLAMDPKERSKVQQPGIPCDTVNNELGDWIINARYANPKLRIAIKGDKASDYKVMKLVIATLQAQNINRFNLVTGMEAKPSLAASE